ncbi:hypothetical protein M0802_013016, partial [Mischocyttarus mexicanus]
MTEIEMNFAKFKKDERCRRLERSLKLSMLKRSGDSSINDQSRNNQNAKNWSFSIYDEIPKAEDICPSSNKNEQRIMTTVKTGKYTSYEPRIAPQSTKKSPN